MTDTFERKQQKLGQGANYRVAANHPSLEITPQELEAIIQLWHEKVEAVMAEFTTTETLKAQLGDEWDSLKQFLINKFDQIVRDLYLRHHKFIASIPTHPTYSVVGLINQDSAASSALKEITQALIHEYHLTNNQAINLGRKLFINAFKMLVYQKDSAKGINEARKGKSERNVVEITGRIKISHPFIRESEE